MAAIENVTPILRVEDLDVSRRYYIQKLGFSLDWDAGGMISLSRDQKSIMLCERSQGQPGTGFGSASGTPMSFSPNSRLRARKFEARRRTLAGPMSSRSRTRTATCFVSGLSRSRDLARQAVWSRRCYIRWPIPTVHAVAAALSGIGGSPDAQERPRDPGRDTRDLTPLQSICVSHAEWHLERTLRRRHDAAWRAGP
jgi:hypothetical protein